MPIKFHRCGLTLMRIGQSPGKRSMTLHKIASAAVTFDCASLTATTLLVEILVRSLEADSSFALSS